MPTKVNVMVDSDQPEDYGGESVISTNTHHEEALLNQSEHFESVDASSRRKPSPLARRRNRTGTPTRARQVPNMCAWCYPTHPPGTVVRPPSSAAMTSALVMSINDPSL